jgi:hypothetical protein
MYTYALTTFQASTGHFGTSRAPWEAMAVAFSPLRGTPVVGQLAVGRALLDLILEGAGSSHNGFRR